MTGDVRIVDGDVLDVTVLDLLKEFAEWKYLRTARRRMLHDIVEQDRGAQYQDPEQNRFCCRIQINPLSKVPRP